MERLPPKSSPRSHARKGSVAPDLPWFLQLDCDDEVVYEDTPIPAIKGGTLPGLVEQLTRHDKLDISFNEIFLLTYKSFASADELFETLLQRFYIATPMELTPAEHTTWVEQKQKTIRFRVVNIMKNWFERFWMESHNDATVDFLKLVHALVKGSPAILETPGCAQLLSVVEQRLQGQESTTRRLVPTVNAHAPSPNVPKNMKRVKFLDIDATEFARQLTIIESGLFRRIRPQDCVNKTWSKKASAESAEPATGVNAMILHSNQLANWVGEMILAQSDLRKRVAMVRHFINVAEKCNSLKNFATMMSIISGLGTTPVYRLHRTWSQVGGRCLGPLEQMRNLMASTRNFIRYREKLRLTNPPCVPFLGVYLTDLTFIDDGIPSLLPNNMISFSKRVKIAEVLQDIQQYQSNSYLLHPVPELQEYIVRNIQAAGDVHELYDRSLELEPRLRDEERMMAMRHGPYAATGSHMSSVVIASMVME